MSAAIGQTILITGATGQVCLELLRRNWPEGVTLLAPQRAELDLASQSSISALFAGRDSRAYAADDPGGWQNPEGL